MDIPGLGPVTKDEEFNWHRSGAMPVQVLGGRICRILVGGYEEDPAKDDYHAAIRDFLSLQPSAMEAASAYVFRYYEDCRDALDGDDEEPVTIESPQDVWRHVRFGDEPMVDRRSGGDRAVYISLECGCDWEQEHGLQIVFRRGQTVCKVGPYDGHLTNSDAYADPRLEHVIYK